MTTRAQLLIPLSAAYLLHRSSIFFKWFTDRSKMLQSRFPRTQWSLSNYWGSGKITNLSRFYRCKSICRLLFPKYRRLRSACCGILSKEITHGLFKWALWLPTPMLPEFCSMNQSQVSLSPSSSGVAGLYPIVFPASEISMMRLGNPDGLVESKDERKSGNPCKASTSSRMVTPFPLPRFMCK